MGYWVIFYKKKTAPEWKGFFCTKIKKCLGYFFPWYVWIFKLNFCAVFFYLEYVRSFWHIVLEAKMQACSGVAVMGSLQQPIWTKGSNFAPKGSSVIGFPQEGRLSLMKLCKSSNVEGSLVTGRLPSSASVPMPEIGGINFTLTDWLFLLPWVLIWMVVNSSCLSA